MLKKENGVTLVALVITIIVLLILAGVTLAMVMGESGIFGKANTAKINTNTSSAESAVSLATLDAVTDQYSDTDGSIGTAIKNSTVIADVNGKLNEYILVQKTAGTDGTSGTSAAAYVKKGNSTSSTYVKNANGDVLVVTFTVDSSKNSVKPVYTYETDPTPAS